ncbi:MAG: hypothetical protein GY736_02125, partial [Sphingomonas sp.]|uniref:hypothetical protein n=1 Tax=Sphingomonas sp. TaxID=28214 RepID=UPI002585EFB6
AINRTRNRTKSYIDGSVVTSLDDVTLDAEVTSNFYALSIGVVGSLARGNGQSGALAFAGSASANHIDNQIASYIANSADVDAGETLTLNAADDMFVRADSGGFAFAVAAATGATPSAADALAAGFAITENSIGNDGGHEIWASIDASDVSAVSGLDITATTPAKIESLAMGGALAAGVSKSGAGLAGAGAGAGA